MNLLRTAAGAVLFFVLLPLRSVQAVEFNGSEGQGWTYQHVMDEYYEHAFNVQDRRGEIPIGLPTFKRRVRLPRIEKTGSETGIHLGQLNLHPAYSQIFEFDDNVRLSDDDRDSDAIFKELPALTADIRNSSMRLSGGYGMEIVNFVENHEENAVNHFAHALFEFEQNDFQLRIEDTLEKSQTRLLNANSTRDKLFANALQVTGKYTRPRWAVEPGWTHNTINHQAPSLEDLSYEEDVISLLGGYKIFPSTLFLIQNDVGFDYYHRKTRNADQNFWQILAGIRGDYIENMKMEAKLGFQTRHLDEVSGQPEQRNFNGLVADVNVSWKIGPRDALLLDYIRTAQPSTFTNNSWFAVDRISVAYSKRLFDKWVITPEFAWFYNRYPESVTLLGMTDKRSDHIYETGIDLRYQVQEWLSAGIGYRFRDRFSNFNNFEFYNNRILCDISLSY